MTIRTINPPMETQYGSDSPAQFAEVKSLQINVDYRPTGPADAIEQWVKVRIEMEVWQGGASAAEGATSLRHDIFEYEVKPTDDVWPLTEINWNAIREYVYGVVQNDATEPIDDPQAYDRGTIFYD